MTTVGEKIALGSHVKMGSKDYSTFISGENTVKTLHAFEFQIFCKIFFSFAPAK